MKKKNEYEIIQHTAIPNLEIFVVEMGYREFHGHSDLEIGLVLKGEILLQVEKESRVLGEGDLFIVNRYRPHAFSKNGENCTILGFQIHPGFYKELDPDYDRILFPTCVERESLEGEKLRSLILDCAKRYLSKEEGYEFFCASKAFSVLYELTLLPGNERLTEKEFAQSRNNSMRMNRISEYLTDHYTGQISLTELANEVGITPCHLSHYVKKALGISIQEYVANLRFEHALRLVTQTKLPMLDICMETGFSSSRYLNQMFIKRFGMTATEYRRQGMEHPGVATALSEENEEKRFSGMEAYAILLDILGETVQNGEMEKG